MGSWSSGYQSMNEGIFPLAMFEPAEINPNWFWAHYDRSGGERRWVLDATFGGNYVGGCSKSGIALSYNDLYSALIGSDRELFAVRFGSGDTDPALVVYAHRGNESSWWPAGGCTVFHVTMSIYKRTYQDATTYSESILGYADADIFKAYTGTLTDTKIFLEFFKDDDTWFVGLSNVATNGSDLFSSYMLWNPTEAAFEQQFPNVEPTPTNPISPEFGKAAKKKGGYNPDHHRKGTFDDSSDKIEVTPKPGASPFSTGFIHGYVVTRSQLTGLSMALFPPIATSPTDAVQALQNLDNRLLNNKRPDYILDFLIVPVVPNTGTTEDITCGGGKLLYSDEHGVERYVTGDPIDITSCYVDKDCGSITVPEYWANFLDFSGTRFRLFLPYIGYVDIEPEYINGGELHVWYRFNVFDGSFMCFVESTSGHSELNESLIGQYAGVAAMHIPIQAQDYSNKISGLISAMGVVAAGATGGISAAVGFGAASSLGNTMIQKPGSTHANGYNASSSFLSHRKPYLIIERQSSQFSEKYPEEKGLPLYIKSKIGDCHGLTVCDNPHLDTIPATMEEKAMILKYLTEGIIV